MVGLVLFSSSVALLLYLKQSNHTQDAQASVTLFVAAKNLKKGELLDAHSIKQAKFPKSSLSFTPLSDTEIMHRYARVDIYKGEPIRKEKISQTKPIENAPLKRTAVKKAAVQTLPKTDRDVEQITQDTISVSLSLFKNNITLLSAGDYVDIVSAIASKSDNFTTKYVALHVKVNHFIANHKVTKSMLRYDEKKQPIRATAVVFSMSPKEIKNFLAVYYKTQQLNANRVYNTNHYGGQLWLIKTPKVINKELQAQKQRLLIDRKVYRKKSSRPQERVRISYEK